jgi:hypothetical protein
MYLNFSEAEKKKTKNKIFHENKAINYFQPINFEALDEIISNWLLVRFP